MNYFHKQIDNQFFVFHIHDPLDPFDGPMSEDEAILLTENYNATEDPTENDENIIIRKNHISLCKLSYLANKPTGQCVIDQIPYEAEFEQAE